MIGSLRLRLSLGLLSVTLGVALLGWAASFWLAYGRVLEHQDEQLRRLVALVDIQPRPLEGFAPLVDSVSFVRVADPRLPQPALPPGLCTLREGLRTVRLPDGDWRVFAHVRSDGIRIVAGQSTSQRDAIARRSAAKTVAKIVA